MVIILHDGRFFQWLKTLQYDNVNQIWVKRSPEGV